VHFVGLFFVIIKNARFKKQNKFEKLVHLVGFIIKKVYSFYFNRQVAAVCRLNLKLQDTLTVV